MAASTHTHGGHNAAGGDPRLLVKLPQGSAHGVLKRINAALQAGRQMDERGEYRVLAGKWGGTADRAAAAAAGAAAGSPPEQRRKSHLRHLPALLRVVHAACCKDKAVGAVDAQPHAAAELIQLENVG